MESLVDRLRPLQEQHNNYLMWGPIGNRGHDTIELLWKIKKNEMSYGDIILQVGEELTTYQLQVLKEEQDRRDEAIKSCIISEEDFKAFGFYLSFDVWGGYSYVSEEEFLRNEIIRASFPTVFDIEDDNRLVEVETTFNPESRYVYAISSRTIRDRLLNRTGYIKDAEELSRFIQGVEFPYDGPKIEVNKGLYEQLGNGNRVEYKSELSLNNIKKVFGDLFERKEDRLTRNIRVFTGRGGMEEINKAIRETAEAHQREYERTQLFTMKPVSNEMPLIDIKEIKPIQIDAEIGKFSFGIANLDPAGKIN